jgi:hypothetical protein
MARGEDHRSGYEMVTGNTPAISEWLDFESMISCGGLIDQINQM